MKTVYRAFTLGREGELRPVIIGPYEQEFYLRYAEGEWTEAPSEYPNAWPFACPDLKSAMRWQMSNTEIWECETRGTREAKTCAWTLTGMRRAYTDRGWLAPQYGALQCAGIKPIRRVA